MKRAQDEALAELTRARRRIAVLTVIGVLLALWGDSPFRSGVDLKWVSVALAKWAGVLACYALALKAAGAVGRSRERLRALGEGH